MSQVTATTGGIKRGAPDSPAPDARPRMTSDQLYRNLLGQVTSSEVLDSPDVLHLFRQIAYPGENGIEKPEEPNDRVQQAFSTLIEHQAFALFSEVFQQYSEGRRTYAEHMGETFEPRLELRLSEGWRAVDVDAMGKAFAGLGLKILTVKAPQGTGREIYPVVSEDACRCIQFLLLKGGVTELQMEAPLAAPELVVEAFAGSDLMSLTLKGSSGSISYRPQEWVGYQRLCDELSRCPRLKHLTIHLGLQQAATALGKLCQKDAPTLLSLNLTLNQVWIRDPDGNSRLLEELEELEESEVVQEVEDEGDMEDVRERQGADRPTMAQCVAQVMEHVGQMRALSELTLRVGRDEANDDLELPTDILEPLNGHENLSTLRICNDSGSCFNVPNVNLLLDLVLFSITCPKLTSVSWTSNQIPEDVMSVVEAFIAAGGKFRDPQAAQRLKEAMLSELFKLKALILGGTLVPTDVLAIFLDLLRGKKQPLETVGLKTCVLDVGAMKDLEDVLRDSPGILAFDIPGDPSSGYCLFDGEDRVYTFDTVEKTFSLDVDGLDDDEARAAEAAFRPLEAFAETLLSGVPAQVARNLRAVLTQRAVKTLTPNLAGLLSLSAEAQKSRLDSQDLSIVAEGVLEQLANAGEFPSAARLSRVVAKLPEGIDPYRANYKEANVRQLVDADLKNKQEVSRQ